MFRRTKVTNKKKILRIEHAIVFLVEHQEVVSCAVWQMDSQTV